MEAHASIPTMDPGKWTYIQDQAHHDFSLPIAMDHLCCYIKGEINLNRQKGYNYIK